MMKKMKTVKKVEVVKNMKWLKMIIIENNIKKLNDILLYGDFPNHDGNKYRGNGISSTK